MQDDLLERIGRKVRAARKKRGWSQDVLADKSGLHRAHVGEIERGETNVTVRTLQTLADTLGLPISEFFKT